MPKPETAQIGPIEYTILYDKGVLDSKSLELRVELLGLTEPYESVIHVAPDMSKDMQSLTLVHELLHAIWFDANLSQVKEPSQENTISLLAPRILNFLRNNKQIVRYVS